MKTRGRGGTRARRLALVLAISGWLLGCEKENPNPPDAMLEDSLGLTADDHVHRVTLRNDSGIESVDPADVVLEPGSYLEFLTQDRQVRVISFLVNEMSAQQADFLRSTGQDQSPPLVELDSRFVVSFEAAPPGRYPFQVEGSGAPARGAVRVESRR